MFTEAGGLSRWVIQILNNMFTEAGGLSRWVIQILNSMFTEAGVLSRWVIKFIIIQSCLNISMFTEVDIHWSTNDHCR